MRQGQPQNRQRSRGRGNNNRNNNNNNRNNMNRSMESNGPDVRIRGTASHIAEKYQQLARDSHSAGDIVAAESYWQHAEHYNRLIAVAQAAQNQAREEQRAQQEAAGTDNNSSENRADGDENKEDGNNRGRGRGRRSRNQGRDVRADDDAGENKTENVNGSGPQPTLDDTPAEVALAEKPVNGPANGSDDEAPAPKPRRARRPRKTDDSEAAPVATEAKQELPSFISGGADE